ncbi:hypothetical protein [Chryseobacterium viscerum]|uniref:hypothetical protein n=1 Tax=Chryseobacterium viscerum TaxID=1037377 RepID=UPI001403EF37|nr:hypothetical protein [Chryseobacterium viscerum]
MLNVFRQVLGACLYFEGEVWDIQIVKDYYVSAIPTYFLLAEDRKDPTIQRSVTLADEY